MINRPQRKPTRAIGFDYRDPGPYFVTICEHRRCNRFGTVADGEMRRNAAGDTVASTWMGLAEKFPTATFDAFVVMPNHVHGLVTLATTNPVVVGEALCGLPHEGAPPQDDGLPSLSEIVGWFKTMTTNWYIRGVRQQRWPPYDGHLWQRSFHDHIVRNDADMDRIRTYISNNPAVWTDDTFFEP